ncbi:MAG: DNA replication/repair protein RecF [Chloroflexi bacterium]|nr:DNA replication/repair protein RecF [Chloroflexota bacterium]
MHVARLNLVNFRNYRQLELALPPHMVIIQGDNAQGKTNLLESIHVMTTTRSHRAASDRELLNHDAAAEDLPFARLSAAVEKAEGRLDIEIVMRLERSGPAAKEDCAAAPAIPLRKRIKVNGIPRRAADLVGQANVVMFSALDTSLITGPPSLSRRYLDLVNSQMDAAYLRSLQRYARVLVQRNHLLRLLQERRGPDRQLDFWDNELVESGSYVVLRRQRLVRSLSRLAQGIHGEVSSRAERLEIAYLPSTGPGETRSEIEQRFREALQRGRRREVSHGMTLAGPHRDGLLFRVNGADLSRYGSRGQQQTTAISLKLAQAVHMMDERGDPPVLLLDDVFSELDRHRRQHLLESIAPFQQVLVSATDLDSFEPAWLAGAACFRVRQGIVEPA